MKCLQTLLALTAYVCLSLGCSRGVYTVDEPDGIRVLSGRTFDWLTATESHLYAFPAGMDHDGAAGSGSLKWTSRYGTVLLAMSDNAITDGINEVGLTGNVLYLKNTETGVYNASKPQVSVAVWLRYFLDMYSSVEDVAKDLYDEDGETKFQVADSFPTHIFPVPPLIHISLADSTGNNMIMEWIGGKLKTYISRKYTVMTNEPPFDEQLALDSYWLSMQNVTLPGTDRPADRFARLTHYARLAKPANSPAEALATLQGMIRAVSVPMRHYDINAPNGGPNIAPTHWRSYADLKDMRYFFESATKNEFIWISLKQLDLSPGSGVRKFTADAEGKGLAGRHGDKTSDFVAGASFVPLPLTDADLGGKNSGKNAIVDQSGGPDSIRYVRSEL